MLDVGCNQGHLIFLLNELFPKSTYVGMDPDKEAVQKASLAAADKTKVSFEVQDAMSLPDEWRSKFDYVITVNSLHHVPDASKAMKQIHRVLKPGGYFSAVEIYVDADIPRMIKHPGSMAYFCFDMVLAGAHGHGHSHGHGQDQDEGHSHHQGEGHGHHHGHGEGHGHHHSEGHGHHHGHGEGHGHHSEEDEREGPTSYQRLTKAIQDGGFKDVHMEGVPQAEFLDQVHLFAVKQ